MNKDATSWANGDAGVKVRSLQGIELWALSSEEAIALVDSALVERRTLCLAFANAHTINIARENDNYRDVLARFVVFNDGFGVDLASRLRYGESFPSNLNGTDFVPNYLLATKNKLRIFMLGAQPHVVERAFGIAQQRFPMHDWVGCRNGYFTPDDELGLVDVIREARPDLLLVAMGNPMQEYCIDRFASKIGIPLYFGVGALFDFWAGSVNRAPEWIRAIKMEWMYRLVQEPKRLWKRYLVGNITFLWNAWKDRR